jgi:hypothetical protein
VESQARSSWTWPIVVATAALAVAVVAVVVGRDWLATQSLDPPAATTQAAPGDGPDERLLEPGDAVTIDAVDASGAWGTINIVRGPDTGGYADNAVDPEAFIIEVFIDYTAVRHPEPEEFGRQDWALATADDRRPIGALYEWVLPPNPAEWDPSRQELGSYPGAIEIIGFPTEGMLYLQVPREAADRELELIYRPAGFSEVVVGILLREAGPAPAPVPTATPIPPPAAVTYVERDGSPFTVIADPEADALFVNPDTCTNPVGGYTVEYPDSWYTNTEFGNVPACSWFSPTSYEVTSSDEVPDEVVITVTVFPGPLGSFTSPDLALNEEVPIGGFTGVRQEQVGVAYESGAYEALPPSYHYFVVMGDPRGDGPRMLATTDSTGVDDYELNKAVLDRIMASLQFED